MLIFTMTACSSSKETAAEWTRDGFYFDDAERMLSVVYMEEDVEEPGWYVGCMLGEDPTDDSWGGFVTQEGNALKGTLTCSGEGDDIVVTVEEEGEKGLVLKVEGGETYHFSEYEGADATIFVSINVEGWGNIDYAEGEEVPEIDPDYPFQSAVINLDAPTTYTFVAAPEAGNNFVKWTKNGEDFSTEPVVTVLLDESADYIAVFEEDPDWQNPVVNVMGDYECDTATANVAASMFDEAFITIQLNDDAEEKTQWNMSGKFDPVTHTIEYTDCTKSLLTYDDEGFVENQDMLYTDGTGTIVFNDDGTMTWHDNMAEGETDLVFQYIGIPEE